MPELKVIMPEIYERILAKLKPCACQECDCETLIDKQESSCLSCYDSCRFCIEGTCGHIRCGNVDRKDLLR